MNNEKSNLNAQSRCKYNFFIVKNGFRMITGSYRNLASFLALLGLFGVLLVLYTYISPEYLRDFVASCGRAIFIAAPVLLLYIYGNIKGGRAYYKNFVRAGFVNSAGEAPFLIDSAKDGKGEILVFQCNGLPLEQWRDSKELLQTVFNATVAYIRPGHDHRTVRVKVVPSNTSFAGVLPWSDDYIDRDNKACVVLGEGIAGETVSVDLDRSPMVLLAGSTGSGKTRLAILMLRQLILRHSHVAVVDFKGLDFNGLASLGAKIMTTQADILDYLRTMLSELQARLELWRAVGATSYPDYIEKSGDTAVGRYMLLIDECAMLTDYGTSKEAKAFSTEVIDALAAIARTGRAVGIHLIVSTQRPDMNAVPGAIKSNLDVRIVGKCDTTLSTMVLGDGRAAALIPPDSQGRFVVNNGYEDIVFQAYFVK